MTGAEARALRWEEELAPEPVRGFNQRAFMLRQGPRTLAILWVPRMDEARLDRPRLETRGVRWEPVKYVAGEGAKPAMALCGVLPGIDHGPEIACLQPLDEPAWDELADRELPALNDGPLQIQFPRFPKVPKGQHPR
jgi:hypothetical protein